MMMVYWRVAGATNILNIKYITPTALNCDDTILQVAEDVSSWMVATLFPTDVSHLLDGPWIHVSTMQKSVHTMAMLKTNVAFLQSLASKTAAQSSSLGITDNCFKGTTYDTEESLTGR